MRYTDITETCFRCGVEGQMAHHHLIPGTPGRALSERYGLVAALCPKCHAFIHGSAPAGIKALQRLRRYGQLTAMREQGWTEDDFRAVFGKSYLEE